MIPTYVLDTGALIRAEQGKQRVARFFRLASIGRARLVVPLPVIAEWWRGRSDAREEILAATQIVASVPAAKAAGIALAEVGEVNSKKAIDAIVVATAALLNAIVVTTDRDDLESLLRSFPGVVLLSA